HDVNIVTLPACVPRNHDREDAVNAVQANDVLFLVEFETDNGNDFSLVADLVHEGMETAVVDFELTERTVRIANLTAGPNGFGDRSTDRCFQSCLDAVAGDVIQDGGQRTLLLIPIDEEDITRHVNGSLIVVCKPKLR